MHAMLIPHGYHKAAHPGRTTGDIVLILGQLGGRCDLALIQWKCSKPR